MFYMDQIERVLQGSMVPRRRGKGARAPRGLPGALPPRRGVWEGLGIPREAGGFGGRHPPMFDSEHIKILIPHWGGPP